MPRSNITYRNFYDFPRMFVVSSGSAQFLFDCPFDEDLDEYPDIYTVYLLPNLPKLALEGSWEQLLQCATKRIGDVSVQAVNFDETRRRDIDTAIIDGLLFKAGHNRAVELNLRE